MDFSKTLTVVPNSISQSKLRYENVPLHEPANEDDHLDLMVIEASNRAVSELILSNSSSSQTAKKFKLSEDVQKEQRAIVDTSLYPSHLIHTEQDRILPNSLVVIFESFDTLSFTYATPGATYCNKNGTFQHDDFIGKPFGCAIPSRTQPKMRVGDKFVYILKPTPELWAKTLTHRTQIIQESDASFIVFQLDLRPNMIVCESGTGSGAMSHVILRSIAPYGKLHTYEFNKARVLAAREEFRKNGVDGMVQVYWRDVCGDPSQEDAEGEEESETIGLGGFHIGPSVAHAIFLDLPEPWKAIPHAAHTILPHGRLGSYSPCIEQCQKTIMTMKKYGFHSIKTFEIRLREYYLDPVHMEQVPTTKLSREPNNHVHISSDVEQNSRNPPILCARPFPTIKGHSAFLTFATATNQKYLDPSKNERELMNPPIS